MNNDYINLKYIQTISTRLKRFKIKSRSPIEVNFRCPVCGDSKKSERKARGWIIQNKQSGSLSYYCHNCDDSRSFYRFIEFLDPTLAKEYYVDLYLSKSVKKNEDIFLTNDSHSADTDNVITLAKNPLKDVKKVSQLAHNHPAKQYVLARQIPPNQHYRLYYTPKFKTWINSVLPGKLGETFKDEPRLLMPLIDQAGVCFGVSGRSFDPKTSLRYMTIMFEERPKIFGLDKVDQSKRFFVVEGPIDSLFLSNSVAMVGADMNSTALENSETAVFVFDLECRNKEIISKMERTIERGFKICIWPKHMSKLGKDINDFVLSGMSTAEIELCIDKNTYCGLEAKLMLMSFKAR